jgi:hypothetical protein
VVKTSTDTRFLPPLDVVTGKICVFDPTEPLPEKPPENWPLIQTVYPYPVPLCVVTLTPVMLVLPVKVPRYQRLL